MHHFRLSRLSCVALLFALVACQAQATPTAVLPAAAPTAVPPTAAPPAVPPTAAPTIVPTPAQTTVSPKIFKIPMSVTFGPDWRYGISSPGAIELLYDRLNLYVDFLIADNATLFISGDPATHVPFPDDFAGYLRSNNYFSDVTPNIPLSIGGVKGYQVEAIGKSLSPNRRAFFSSDQTNFKEFVGTEPQKYRFIYVGAISGQRLLVIISSDVDPGLSPLSVSQFDALMPTVQEVLDTVVFSKP